MQTYIFYIIPVIIALLLILLAGFIVKIAIQYNKSIKKVIITESFLDEFTSRQYMVTSDFEYFHCRDMLAVDVEYHNHDFYEIFLYLSGKVTYVIEGRSYKLRAGDILIIHNKDVHRPIVEPGEPYERIVLWVDPDYLQRKSEGGSNLALCFETRGASNYNLLRLKPDKLQEIFTILEKFEKSCRSQSFGSAVLRDVYLAEYIVMINKAFFDDFSKPISKDISFNENVNKIVEYINENLEKNLSLEVISKKFFMSKYHLEREFKKYTGYTIHKFAQQKRLFVAKNLLNQGISVNFVCSMCGFNDYSNFIRAFKNAYGLPPKKYIESKS